MSEEKRYYIKDLMVVLRCEPSHVRKICAELGFRLPPPRQGMGPAKGCRLVERPVLNRYEAAAVIREHYRRRGERKLKRPR